MLGKGFFVATCKYAGRLMKEFWYYLRALFLFRIIKKYDYYDTSKFEDLVSGKRKPSDIYEEEDLRDYGKRFRSVVWRIIKVLLIGGGIGLILALIKRWGR